MEHIYDALHSRVPDLGWEDVATLEPSDNCIKALLKLVLDAEQFREKSNSTQDELSANQYKLLSLQSVLEELSTTCETLQGKLEDEQEAHALRYNDLMKEHVSLRILNATLSQRLRDAFHERDEYRRYSDSLSKEREAENQLKENIERLKKEHQRQLQDKDAQIIYMDRQLRLKDSEISSIHKRFQKLYTRKAQDEDNPISPDVFGSFSHDSTSDGSPHNHSHSILRAEMQDDSSISGVIDSSEKLQMIYKAVEDLEAYNQELEFNVAKVTRERDSLKKQQYYNKDNEQKERRYPEASKTAYHELQAERDRLANLLRDSEEECCALEQRLEEKEEQNASVTSRFRQSFDNDIDEVPTTPIRSSSPYEP